MKRILVILLTIHCSLFTIHCSAQLQGQARIDSLLKELPKQKEDTGKVNILCALSYTYRSSNPDEGIKYGMQGLELATKLGWKKGITNANYHIGNCYHAKSDFAPALEYLFKALKMNEEAGNKKYIANVTGIIGNVYATKGDNPKALEYLIKALKMDEDGQFTYQAMSVINTIANVYDNLGNYPKALEYYFKALKMDNNGKYASSISGNIGNIYTHQKNYPKALEYYFKVLKFSEESGDKVVMAIVNNNIGNIYGCQGDYPKALEYLFKALKMTEELGNKGNIAATNNNIGAVYEKQKNYTMAIEYSQRALKMNEELGIKEGTIYALSIIGVVYTDIVKDQATKNGAVTGPGEVSMNKYRPSVSIPAGKEALLSGAINSLQRALALSKEIHSPEHMLECYTNLSDAYKLKNDYKKAMEYGDSSKVIKDSIYSEANTAKMAQLESDRKEYGDSLKAADAQKAADIKAAHRRNYELLGCGALLLAIGFIFLLGRNNKLLGKEKKENETLLHNILPEEVASQLKQTGKSAAKLFDNVTVLFTDFVNFTEASERMSPEALIEELDTCFKAFDGITGKYNVEKIKTIGDAYLAVCGLPSPDPKHAENVVRAAVEINAFMADRLAKLGSERTFRIRIGIHSGSVVAGIVGVKKFAYDIWGDTVNTAARMEQNSEAGKINISETTYELVKGKFSCEYRGEVEAKGKGVMKMYFVSVNS